MGRARIRAADSICGFLAILASPCLDEVLESAPILHSTGRIITSTHEKM